jgi:cellulose synthase (UDP-forming)
VNRAVPATRANDFNALAAIETAPAAMAKVRLSQRIGYIVLMLIGLAFAAGFGHFWFAPGRLPHDFSKGKDAADLVLFGALTFVVWHRLILDIAAWLLCTLVRSHQQPPVPRPGLRVAFITTFVPSSESLALLQRTVTHMVAADYQHDTWVLDEGDDPAARAMCRRLGAYHFTRKGRPEFNTKGGRFAARTKGGNHNAWYAVHQQHYDIVASVDTDFVVRRDFLTHTLGYFNDPTVGFVGTPQVYGNTGNWIARGAAQQTYLFYGPILRALSSMGMALLIGANHVERVSALRDAGWYQGHLTEDLATGKRYHAARWRSIYVPEVLAVGEGPTSWGAFFAQQYRWAAGDINIFFTDSLHLNLRMRPLHGFMYFMLEQFYFSGLRFALAMALLLLYYVTGWTPADIPLLPLLTWYVPLLVWQQIMIRALQGFNVRPDEEGGSYLEGRLITIGTIPVYFLAFVGVLLGRRMTFNITRKGHSEELVTDRIGVFRSHFAVCGVLALCMIVGWGLNHRLWVFDAWGIGTIVIYLGLAATVLWRQVAVAARITEQAATLDLDGQTWGPAAAAQVLQQAANARPGRHAWHPVADARITKQDLLGGQALGADGRADHYPVKIPQPGGS